MEGRKWGGGNVMITILAIPIALGQFFVKNICPNSAYLRQFFWNMFTKILLLA
jgi:hypothetical protein